MCLIICFVSRSENNGGVKPSDYSDRTAADHTEIVRTALCSDSLFQDLLDSLVEEAAEVTYEGVAQHAMQRSATAPC